MTIKYGTSIDEIKKATAEELLDAIITTDGCGCDLKENVVCELLKRASMYQEQDILDALDARMEKRKENSD
jgi:hypothetical protein